MTVEIKRGEASVFPVNLGVQNFKYAVPLISSVLPLYGPTSGGTVVTIKGSDLNISDISNIKVLLAGETCIIQ